MHGSRGASLTREAAEAPGRGASRRDNRGRQGTQDRTHASGQGTGNAPTGEQIFRLVLAGLWGLHVWIASQGPTLAAAQDLTPGIDVLVHFDSEASLTQVCRNTTRTKEWNGVVHAAQVVMHPNHSDFNTESALVFTNALDLNGTVTYNNKVKIQGQRSVQPYLGDAPKTDNSAAALYPNYTCAATGVHAYIIDTGVRGDHNEFLAVDGSTRVMHDWGNYPHELVGDCNGHGTHVAGILGGATVGIANNVTIHAIRVMGCDGSGDVSGMLDGLNWVFANMQRPAVVSMSLGLDVVNPVLDAAVGQLASLDVMVLVAAGNSASDACLSSLGSSEGGYAVGAVNDRSAQADFSNYGPCVKVWADGVAINSSWNTGPRNYMSLSGTSMSTPAVAGISARLLSEGANLTRNIAFADLSFLSKRTTRGNILVPLD